MISVEVSKAYDAYVDYIAIQLEVQLLLLTITFIIIYYYYLLWGGRIHGMFLIYFYLVNYGCSYT